MDGIQSGGTKKHKIAGFFSQVRIITWKNLMLYKQNRSGIACEIIFSCLFTLLFVFLVYFGNPDYTRATTDDYDMSIIARGFFPGNDEIKNSTRMFYYPDNEWVRSIVQRALDTINASSLISLNVALNSANVSSGADLSDDDKRELFALISFADNFTSASSVPDSLEYSIFTKETANYRSYKTNQLFRPKTEYMYSQSPEASCQADFYNTYKYDYFNAIKYSVDLSLIQALTNKQLNPNNILLKRYKCPDYINDLLKTYLSFFTPVLVSLAFLVTFLVTISSIIREKESKMKEYLRLIGVNPVVIWLCWMMRSFVIYLLITCILTVTSTLKLPMRDKNPLTDHKSLFLTTDTILVLFMFIVYSIQVTSLSLLAGQIFSKPFMAKTIGIIFWFVTFFNYYNSFSAGAKYILCIMPNTALTFATQVIFQYERSLKHIGMSHLYSNLFDDGLTLGGVLLAMILWSCFYLILSWYIERIFPGEYGVKMPFYFPFMPSYWFDNTKCDEERVQLNAIYDEDSDGFEQEPTGLYASVKIENLTKKFKVGWEDKTVVNNISLNFYENQITGFLGHNGAGKTTVTFMLCGMYTPNSGTAYILGHDIRTQMSRIRTSIGFCPQSNILYDELTVRQHLDLVASIKGFSNKEIKAEITRISTFVGLQNDLNKKSMELSGGMKRRLSVAMALIGDSKVIILDEPTSGLDPFNRRSLWELIRNYKQGRTIILTTHYMEEADALSDRIALMNHGQVKCCGSPLFLKNRFGSGYRLTITKDTSVFSAVAVENLVERVTGRPALVESNIAREMCIAIPTELSACLPELLTYIEDNKKPLGIFNYGISSSTVEEVFLKIGSIDINENIFPRSANKRKTSDQSSSEVSIREHGLATAFSNTTGVEYKNTRLAKLIPQQLWALFLKRARILGRRYVIAIFTLLLPVVLEAVLSAIIPSSAVVISDAINSLFGVRNLPPFKFDMYKYGEQFVPTNANDTLLAGNFSAYIDRQAVLGKKQRNSLKLIDDVQDMDNYVYKERKSLVQNIIGNYFFGFDLGINRNEDEITARAFYSTFPYHTSATLLNQLDSFIYAYYAQNLDKSITTINAPVSVSIAQNFSGFNPNDLNFFSCIEGIPFSYLDMVNGIIIAFVIACTTISLIRERTSGSKSLQLLSGTHYLTYWLSNLIFDVCVYAFTIATMVIAIRIVAEIRRVTDNTNDTVIVGYKSETLLYLLAFLLLVSLSWALLAYTCSFFFKSDVIGFVIVLLVLGFACLFDMIMGYLKLLDVGVSGGKVGTLGKITDVVRYVLVFLFPNVAVKRAVFNLKLQNMPICIPLLNVGFQEPGIGKFALLNSIFLLVIAIILLLLETRIIIRAAQNMFNRMKRPKLIAHSSLDLESDVRDESNRIMSSNLYRLANEEPILVRDLTRIFKKNGMPFKAVNNLSFGVRPAECFGLLGLNGAGKTTAIQILTGQLQASAGAAFVNGYDIFAQRLDAIRSLGYCPQFDYLPEYLTAREALELYANLRGLKKKYVKGTVDDFINAFKLNEFEKKLVQDLSGGNKRKVSSAISFVGKPKTVILDEPTSGMDPAARRYLWNVIKNARDCGVTILLTTHSMEESEALCTNLGIMVNGQFECFGNIQHLKSKYGKGYSLIIKCKTDLEQDSQQTAYYVNYIERFIQANIPNAFIKDKQQQTLFYQIMVEDDQLMEAEKPNGRRQPSASLSIAKIFALIESNKEALNIETYSLSQTTLEQVFLSFARKQTDPNQFHLPVRFTTTGASNGIQAANDGNEARFAANRVGNTNRAFDESDTTAAIVVQDLRV